MRVLPTLMAIVLAAQIPGPLDQASQAAELFWDQFMAVQSVERVTQFKLRPDGKVISSKTSEFDYVASLKARSKGVAVEESRVSRSESASQTRDPFLLTSGFPALLLMFHPDFRGKFEFTELPAVDEPAGLVRIAFRSRPEEHSMSALKVSERLYPILWRGYAWIEMSTGNVTRIEASLDRPMGDIGVTELRAEVDYRATPLRNNDRSYRLPARVVVWVRTPRQYWRNDHEFSDYRLFTVTTSTRGQLDGR